VFFLSTFERVGVFLHDSGGGGGTLSDSAGKKGLPGYSQRSKRSRSGSQCLLKCMMSGSEWFRVILCVSEFYLHDSQ
jgi:hypothetical protein